MKKLLHILSVFICIGASFQVNAQQQVNHEDDWFRIMPGTLVTIKGSLTSLVGNPQQISNQGTITISDSVVCYGDNKIFGDFPDTVTASVYLDGTTKQQFLGDQNMRFGNLYIQNTSDSLEVLNTVEIANFIQLDQGNVLVENDTLNLIHTGRIIGETNDDRIYTNEYGVIRLERPLIGGNSYANIAGTGLDISADGNLGASVEVFRRNHEQVNVANGSTERYFYFNPTQNGFVSAAGIHYLDPIELGVNNEDSLSLYLSETSGSTWTHEGGTLNTSTDYVNMGASDQFVLTQNSMITLASKHCDSLPYIHFDVDTIPLCGGDAAYLSPDGVIGMSSAWSTGVFDQDSIQVSSPGVYSVEITNLYGCSNSDSVVVITAPNPVADFTVGPVCTGDTSLFNNLSTIASGTMTYVWELGDVYTTELDTSTLFEPSIAYSNVGTYTAELTVTSNYGCTVSTTKNAIALPYPEIDFTVDNACGDSLLTIANSTTVSPNAGILYNWDFGNGDTSTDVNPMYAFQSIGTQTISLTATSNGCVSDSVVTVEIYPNPTASFTNASTCFGDLSSFVNTSTIASGTISSNWTFGPGATTTLDNPDYAFSAAGTYPVNLEVSSNNGCSHDTTISVTVLAIPVPSFTAASNCSGQEIQFANTSNATSSFSWDFDGEATSTSFDTQYVFNSNGDKLITLTETDINGCTGTTTQIVQVWPQPIANFMVSDGCENEAYSFYNLSSTPAGAMTYQWDFQNGSTATAMNPSATYLSAGAYNVQLITTVGACSDTIEQVVNVNPLPVINLGGLITTCGSSYVLDAQNPGSTYLWSDNSTQQTFTANYDGQYWVAVTNGFGCTMNDTVQVGLNSNVVVDLGPDDTFCDQITLDAGYPGATFSWSTGETTQTINVTTSGTYSVTVTDANGCTASDAIVATIVNTTQPNLGPDVVSCTGNDILLDPNASGVSYVWSDGSSMPDLLISNGGTYWVSLTDANGCVGIDTIEVVYNPLPIVDLGADGNYCDGLNLNVSQPNVSYLWDDNSTLDNRTLNMNGQYWVTLTDLATNCINSDTINVTFSPTPVVDLGVDTLLCNGEMITLDAGVFGTGYNYSWNVLETTQTIEASSSGTYAVQVTSPENCVGTDSIEITVNPPVNTWLGDDFIICNGSSQLLTSPVNSGQYFWYHNDSLVLDGLTSSYLVTSFGEYVVNVIDQNNCTGTDTIQALESPNQMAVDFLVATTGAYEGDTIKFVNLSMPANAYSHWSFGDGSFSIEKSPEHTYFFEGFYDVTLFITDSVCSASLTKTVQVFPQYIPTEEPEEEEIVLNEIEQVVLYPNPNDGRFTLAGNLLEEGTLHIDCFSAMGSLIFSDTVIEEEFEINYDTSQYPAGVYLLRIRLNEQVKTIRYIVQ